MQLITSTLEIWAEISVFSTSDIESTSLFLLKLFQITQVKKKTFFFYCSCGLKWSYLNCAGEQLSMTLVHFLEEDYLKVPQLCGQCEKVENDICSYI